MNQILSIGFIPIPGLLLLWFFTTTCEETFEPWEENDQYHFSIYGFLDASADTQWVRVMPVREDLFYEPKPIDATVTLTHVESGESVIMNDSLFAYAHNRYAWNFWTTMDVQPDQTYQIVAERPDGKSSSSTVQLPENFPVPVVTEAVNDDNVLERLFIHIEGVERLADVQTLFHVRFVQSGEEVLIPFSHLKDTTRRFPNDFDIQIDILEEELEVNNRIGSSASTVEIFRKQIFVAAAGPDYPHFATIDEPTVFRPDGVTNIENGTGYLAGIVSKTIPYKSCRGEGMALIPCEPEPPPW